MGDAGSAEGLWLEPIPGILRSKAVDAFERRDALGFLTLASNECSVERIGQRA